MAATFISERYPYGGERVYYGYPVPKRLYSYADLYQRTGIHAAKASKIVRHLDIETHGHALDAQSVAKFEAAMDGMVDFDDVAKIWGVTRETARNLVSEGLHHGPAAPGAIYMNFIFHRSEVEGLLAQAMGYGHRQIPSSKLAGELLTIRQAAAQPGISHLTIVRGLLAGKLRPAAVVADRHGLASVLLDPSDVQGALPKLEGLLTTTEVARVLGLNYSIVAMLGTRGLLGPRVSRRNAHKFHADIVDKFKRGYVSSFRSAQIFQHPRQDRQEVLGRARVVENILN